MDDHQFPLSGEMVVHTSLERERVLVEPSYFRLQLVLNTVVMGRSGDNIYFNPNIYKDYIWQINA